MKIFFFPREKFLPFFSIHACMSTDAHHSCLRVALLSRSKPIERRKGGDIILFHPCLRVYAFPRPKPIYRKAREGGEKPVEVERRPPLPIRLPTHHFGMSTHCPPPLTPTPHPRAPACQFCITTISSDGQTRVSNHNNHDDDQQHHEPHHHHHHRPCQHHDPTGYSPAVLLSLASCPN